MEEFSRSGLPGEMKRQSLIFFGSFVDTGKKKRIQKDGVLTCQLLCSRPWLKNQGVQQKRI